jgi:threonine dehydrogenase-like Zn-dependent dehydrogenase
VVRMRASTICGSDLRAIYREHLGTGAEAYQGVIGGHEPCGEVVEVGPGCDRVRVGDRVALYHISGCLQCDECRRGYLIGCLDPLRRKAYGWQRDGGHADYLLADEATCVLLPDALSFLDGACVACGFGTAYEALCRAGVSGRDVVLITGMGPVGLAAGLMAGRMGAPLRIGVDLSEDRLALARRLGAVDEAVSSEGALEQVLDLTGGQGCEVTLDASGAASARELALRATRHWGRSVMVGEGGRLEIDVSPLLIHPQVTLIGSWVTSTWRMALLVEDLVRWDLHPEVTVTDTFDLDDVAQAYRTADAGQGGKVAVVMP